MTSNYKVLDTNQGYCLCTECKKTTVHTKVVYQRWTGPSWPTAELNTVTTFTCNECNAYFKLSAARGCHEELGVTRTMNQDIADEYIDRISR